MITERRRFSFFGFDTRPIDAMRRIAAGDGIAVEQMVIKAGQSSQLAADGCAEQAPAFQIGAPGEHMRSGYRAKLVCSREAYETAEVLKVALLNSASARAVDIGEPLNDRWHGGQVLEFRSR